MTNLCTGSVYDRGAMTLHALRVRIGNRAFFLLPRTWVTARRYGTVSTADFVAPALQISHRERRHTGSRTATCATRSTSGSASRASRRVGDPGVRPQAGPGSG